MNPCGQYVHWITFSPARSGDPQRKILGWGKGWIINAMLPIPTPLKLKLHQVHHGDGGIIN